MKIRSVITSLVLAGALGFGTLPAGLVAQDAPGEVQADPLFESLFTPELIMQHRRAINLDDRQRDEITRLIADLQGKVLSLQWELLDEMQEMTAITSAPRVDLDRALDRMDGVLELEKRIKQAHLETLVRIKNLLRPDQQARLRQLRDAGRPAGG